MSNDNLSELYRIRFPASELSRKSDIWKVICEDYLQRYVDAESTVVDIACGYGEFINNIRAARKIAVDLNLDAQSFLAPNVEFNNCAATELSVIVNGEADVVFTSNFLEHLPDKPALDLFLEQVMLALKPGGRYIILGPNLRYLPGQYWDFYDHHLGLTHLSLCEALQLKKFAIEMCIDRFLPYTTQGALPTHPILVKAYLKTPLIWPILGKQFFVIARKPV